MIGFHAVNSFAQFILTCGSPSPTHLQQQLVRERFFRFPCANVDHVAGPYITSTAVRCP